MRQISAQTAPVLPIEIRRIATLPSAGTGSGAFTIYDPQSGRIVKTGSCAPDAVERQLSPGCALLHVDSDCLRDYVDVSVEPPTIRPRPVIASLSDLPIPSTVSVYCHTTGTQSVHEVHDGSFDYVDLPGRYRITVKSWPCHDAIFEVEL